MRDTRCTVTHTAMRNVKRTGGNHIYALVDCNNFYASCERAFDPSLEGKPVVILSNNDGCAVALSNEAKGIGIKVGTPIFQVESLVKKHNVQVLSSNYTLYGDMSKRVMEVISEFSPDIEYYSIDECFLGLDGLSGNLTSFGKKIREKVKRWTGIPVSVGIARTKTLAKIANRLAKKTPGMGGAFNIVDHARMDEILKKVLVEDIWGVGPRNAKKLFDKKIITAFDLKNADDAWIRKNLGGIVGLRTVWELRGISCIPLEGKKDKQQIISSRSFGKSIDNIHSLYEAVSMYTATAAKKLRSQNSLTSAISVFIATNRFREDEPQYNESAVMKLAVPTNDTSVLIGEAGKLLEKIYRDGYKYKKAGIVLLDIIPVSDLSSYLFVDQKEALEKQSLMKAVDSLHERFGVDALQYASFGMYRPWEMRRERLSPSYTTDWEELLTINI